MRSFGASAPLKDLVKKFGFTPEHIVAAAKEQLRAAGSGRRRSTMTIIERAVELVADDSRIGLGSGHAAQAFVKALGERIRSRGACASTGCLPRRRRQVCPGRKAFR